MIIRRSKSRLHDVRVGYPMDLVLVGSGMNGLIVRGRDRAWVCTRSRVNGSVRPDG